MSRKKVSPIPHVVPLDKVLPILQRIINLNNPPKKS